MSTSSDAQEAILAKIAAMAPQASSSSVILKLAEAYAYAVSPNNSHGGSSNDD